MRTSFSRPDTANVQGERGKIRKLYSDGERKVTFLALQCIGFNDRLYDALLAARSPKLREAEKTASRTIGKRRRQGETKDDGGDRSETEGSGDELMF